MSVWTKSPLVVGHRGGRGAGWPPENTIEAFEQARTQGAEAIELDARTCKNGEVVVFHDTTLARMTEGRDSRRMADLSTEDRVRIDLGHGVRVPTLEGALGWARERGMGVNVELKHDVSSRMALVRGALRAVRASGADVLVSSFDPLLIAMVAAISPRVSRALLVHEEQALWADALQEIARPPWVGSLHLEHTQSSPQALARYKCRGLRIGAWTLNDPGEALELVRLGVATVITDAPGAILDALRGRR